MDKGTGHSSEQHPIRVLIRDEDIGDISAHSWMHIAPEGTDGAEGHGWRFEVGKAQGDQVYVMSVHRGGQVDRGSFLRWFDLTTRKGGVGGASSIPPAPMTTRLRGSRRASSSQTRAAVGPPPRRPEVGIESSAGAC
jgi:hypothetical protein